jgi:hypothetical protein
MQMTAAENHELAKLQAENSRLRVRCEKLEAWQWWCFAALLLMAAALAGGIAAAVRTCS